MLAVSFCLVRLISCKDPCESNVNQRDKEISVKLLQKSEGQYHLKHSSAGTWEVRLLMALHVN